MKIKLFVFGILTDIMCTNELNYAEASDTDSLDSEFKKKYPEFKNIPYRIAVNHNIVSGNTLLNDGDEVAFLPPFSGG